MDDKTLIAEVLDAHGRKTAVYQDREGVTLDYGLTDRNLTQNAAAELTVALVDAVNAAALWQATQEESDDAEA